ncbi:uncharacterized protein LOC114244497 [Bombyx mandarina]|uniref:Uncharacterized protein LOC114244497 n=1 Tax=Bombyx mandarina TaxID=7092 RepID=A0A6J2JS76_BOMMA|nr:uncharacterized protein LOC114244497 [Bombyx mandarina]
MSLSSQIVICIYLTEIAFAVNDKPVVIDQEDSRVDDEDTSRTESWDRKKGIDITYMPFIKKRNVATEKHTEYEDEKTTTEKTKPLHPNELLFPLIYKQSHVNSMFKFGENWYTWSTEKRTDGSKATNYYICYDEPKRCDDIGWERTDTLPKCAFEIDSLTPDDRACINSFGEEHHLHYGGFCDGAEQMKVSEMVRSCGPRIRSLWRFVRVGRRPANAAKPADVNSLICDDEEECFVTIEYRIHHDRITFSLHEPTRGQTFKSALKREVPSEDENKVSTTTETRQRSVHRSKKIVREETKTKKFRVKPKPKVEGKDNYKVKERNESGYTSRREDTKTKKFRVRPKTKVEGKGVVKERNDSGYTSRRIKNEITFKEDISNDTSE